MNEISKLLFSISAIIISVSLFILVLKHSPKEAHAASSYESKPKYVFSQNKIGNTITMWKYDKKRSSYTQVHTFN